jgi:hypothetical protein
MPDEVAFHFRDLEFVVVHPRDDFRLKVFGEEGELCSREMGAYMV